MSRCRGERTGPRSDVYESVVDSLVSSLAEVVRCRDHERSRRADLDREDVARRLANVGLMVEDAKGLLAQLRREVE